MRFYWIKFFFTISTAFSIPTISLLRKVSIKNQRIQYSKNNKAPYSFMREIKSVIARIKTFIIYFLFPLKPTIKGPGIKNLF